MPAQKLKTQKSGFTLLELMIAISIIAVISAVGITTFSQSQKLARDSKRKSDLRAVAVALEIYYQKNGRYPCATTGTWNSSNEAASPWIIDYNQGAAPCDGSKGALGGSYIQSVPRDPIESGPNAWATTNNGYHYQYTTNTAGTCPANGQFYILVTQLENKNDPDRVEVKNPLYCNGVVVYTSSGGFGFNSPSMFAITSY